MGPSRLLSKKTRERIAVFSDGTCDTAETYVRAILSQFKRSGGDISRYPRIRTEEQLLKSLDSLKPPFLIAYTFATERLRKLMWTETKARHFLGVDVLYPAIDIFSEFFKDDPSEAQGVFHSTQAVDYFDRIEALEFTVKHDDGMQLSSIHEADIILTGVSRTSKTPTCMYLAHKGYRVANVPLVPGIDTPAALLNAATHNVPVIFLTIEARQLAKIRKARVEKLGPVGHSSDSYSDIKKIAEELEAAHRLAKRYDWPVIDVTNKAVEETASEILLLVAPKDS